MATIAEQKEKIKEVMELGKVIRYVKVGGNRYQAILRDRMVDPSDAEIEKRIENILYD